MNLFKPGESDFRRRRCGSIRILLVLLVLQFCNVTLSSANPRRINEEPFHQVWNFDIETAGMLPPNVVVGTLVDGQSMGNWQVIEMKPSLDLLQDLERRGHQRIKKILQALAAPSPTHVIANSTIVLSNRITMWSWFRASLSPILISTCSCSP